MVSIPSIKAFPAGRMTHTARNWDHCLDQAALSDIGSRRLNNQDSQAVVLASGPEKWRRRGHLFMVADGMGAHAAGELASKLATDTIPLTYHKLNDRAPPDALREAIEDTNRIIHARGEASGDFRGMGTTASVLVLLPQGALIAHVGDSRVYRLRQGHLEQLTFDHSLVWELRAAEKTAGRKVPDYVPKNVITRSLGPNPTVQIDLEGLFSIEVGDVFLLCSDGLSGQVSDEEIGKVLCCLPTEEAVRSLADLANLRGGPDNITVVVAGVTGPELTEREATDSEHSRGSGPASVAGWVVCGVLALAALGFAVAAQMLGAFWLGIGAAACGVGGVVAAVFASTLQKAEPVAIYEFDGQPLGKGPYANCRCMPDALFANELAGMAIDLRQAAEQERWPIDEAHFNDLVGQAAEAVSSRDYAVAVRQYCRAISYLFARRRAQCERT